MLFYCLVLYLRSIEKLKQDHKKSFSMPMLLVAEYSRYLIDFSLRFYFTFYDSGCVAVVGRTAPIISRNDCHV